MKTVHLFVLFFCISLIKVSGQGQSNLDLKRVAEKVYINEIYHFSVAVPENWKLYGQILNDTIKHMAIADWGLPKIYSDIEKTDIENSISIRAYKKTEINSVDKLIQFEYLRINPSTTSLEIDKSNVNARKIYITTPMGLKYQGKTYFIFKNGIGYIATFMATPGTYEKNIHLFETFFTNVKYF